MSKFSYAPLDCFLCGAQAQELLAVFNKPPVGENAFGFDKYYRELYRCPNCGLISNHHDHDLSEIYDGDYRYAAYNGDKLFEKFKKIMSLPYSKSDNKGRVDRIIRYFSDEKPKFEKTVCDVGSGMGVFPAEMAYKGWDVTAVDPDPQNVHHLNSLGKINVYVGYFPHVLIPQKFNLVTFNKVLEHIEPIVEALMGAKTILAPQGLVYVELPDGEYALREGLNRQEFFLEHFYAFSMPSLSILAKKAGFTVDFAKRIRDPSGKYTLYAFLSPAE